MIEIFNSLVRQILNSSKMKNLVIVFIFIGFANSAFCQNDAVVVLANEKFNQFLNLRDFSISKSNDEIYFTAQSPSQEISQILYLKKVKGRPSKTVVEL